jgi:hypothetical protein
MTNVIEMIMENDLRQGENHVKEHQTNAQEA